MRKTLGWVLRLGLLTVGMVVVASQVMRIFDIWTALQVVLSGISLYLFIKIHRFSRGRRIAGWIGLVIWCIMTYVLVLEPALAVHYHDQNVPAWMNTASPFIAAFAPFIPLWAAAHDPLWETWK